MLRIIKNYTSKLLSFLPATHPEVSPPLISTNDNRISADSNFFAYLPTDLISHVASFLTLNDMANFITDKRIKNSVEKAPINYAFVISRNEDGTIKEAKQATYTELNKFMRDFNAEQHRLKNQVSKIENIQKRYHDFTDDYVSKPSTWVGSACCIVKGTGCLAGGPILAKAYAANLGVHGARALLLGSTSYAVLSLFAPTAMIIFCTGNGCVKNSIEGRLRKKLETNQALLNQYETNNKFETKVAHITNLEPMMMKK